MPGNDIGSTHAITVSDSGDANNDPGTSTPWVEMVKVHSPTSLLASGSPSFGGQSVTFNASVHRNWNFATDGEVISFVDGKTLMGTAAISGGNAKFTTSPSLPNATRFTLSIPETRITIQARAR